MRTKIKKYLGMLGALWCAMALGSFTNSVQAQAATDVLWFDFPTSLPNTSTPEFSTLRDLYLRAIATGAQLPTGSRVNNPLVTELKQVGEAGDIGVSSTTNSWRSIFDPSGSGVANQFGNRQYDTVLVVGVDGQIVLNWISYRVLCSGGITNLSNSASLEGLSYSVSRIGIDAGPDGQLLTEDDLLDMSAVGTTPHDAVLFIGARVGALVNNPTDLATLNNAISPSGSTVVFEYTYVFESWTNIHTCSVTLYRQGAIPSSQNGVRYFFTPTGLIFSLVGPAGSEELPVSYGTNTAGPWTVEASPATEGYSRYFPWGGANGSPMGYLRRSSSSPEPQAKTPQDVSLMTRGTVKSSVGSELDQDQ